MVSLFIASLEVTIVDAACSHFSFLCFFPGIPHLLPPAKDGDEVLDAMDDGFGAFRPSTSFNDLPTLLTSSATEAEKAKAVAPVAAPAEKKATKKRAASAEVASSPKRKASATRRVSVATKKDTKPKGKAADTADTPNPLTGEAGRAQPAKLSPVPAQTVSATGLATAAAAAAAASAAAATSKAAAAAKAEEDDFKTIAQAAVSSLIMSAGTGTKSIASSTAETTTKPSGSSTEKVDTSTEHIKALTGNNWVAACAGAAIGVVPVPTVPDNKANNRARRQNLTADERARQNRDRNREHARNTRLRKKAYVEELKRTLTELVAQRDAAELEKRQSAQRELEQREVRFRVIEEFLKLRGRNETNFARWAAILEDGFSLTLPLTDFNKMVGGEVAPGSEHTLNGVSDVMADANVFSSFLQTLGSGQGAVTCQFQSDRKNFFMDGCQAVLEWTATSVGAIAKGAPSELALKGTVRGKFSPASNKLLSAKISCDTGSVILQLQKLATAKGEPAVLEAAQAAASQADAILDSLQMPCLPSSAVPSAVIVHSSSSSEGSTDKGDQISDESDGEHADNRASVAA